jgi:cobalamin biosynthesis protein CobD/CbiB
MRKSATTCLLDSVRYLLIICGGVTVLCLCWIKVHWALFFVAAIPVSFVMFYFVYLLMLPLYFQTPEHMVVSRILKTIGKGDFDKALRILVIHEKSHSARLRVSRATIEAIRHASAADLFFAPLFLLLLLLPGYETAVEHLSILNIHPALKFVFPCLVFGLCFSAVTWKIWTEWRNV